MGSKENAASKAMEQMWSKGVPVTVASTVAQVKKNDFEDRARKAEKKGR